MVNTIGWVIIGLVAVFTLLRIVTARYRNGRKMLERLSREELEGLNQDMLKSEGLEGVYKDVLKRRAKEELSVLNEWAKQDSVGKPYKVWVVRRDKPQTSEQRGDSDAGTTKNR